MTYSIECKYCAKNIVFYEGKNEYHGELHSGMHYHPWHVVVAIEVCDDCKKNIKRLKELLKKQKGGKRKC